MYQWNFTMSQWNFTMYQLDRINTKYFTNLSRNFTIASKIEHCNRENKRFSSTDIWQICYCGITKAIYKQLLEKRCPVVLKNLKKKLKNLMKFSVKHLLRYKSFSSTLSNATCKICMNHLYNTAWKVSVFRVVLVLIFPHSD